MGNPKYSVQGSTLGWWRYKEIQGDNYHKIQENGYFQERETTATRTRLAGEVPFLDLDDSFKGAGIKIIH